MLPANLHYHNPNPNVPSLHSGVIKVLNSSRQSNSISTFPLLSMGGGSQVVADNTPWHGGTAALSSFGFGGSNVHMLIRGSPPKSSSCVVDEVGEPEVGEATIIPLASRTSQGMNALAAAVKARTSSTVSNVTKLKLKMVRL